jgi:Transcriptional regulator containing an amidase domain and an AraC-type DNA-binding HTH domain
MKYLKNNQNSRRSFINSLFAIGTLATALRPFRSLAEDNSGTTYVVKDDKKLILGMVLFDRFQLLDTFGPLEMFGSLHEHVSIYIISQKGGLIKSSAGPAVMSDFTFENVPKLDILMIPGGGGTRIEVNNLEFIASFKKLAIETPLVASICTGAAILAKNWSHRWQTCYYK